MMVSTCILSNWSHSTCQQFVLIHFNSLYKSTYSSTFFAYSEYFGRRTYQIWVAGIGNSAQNTLLNILVPDPYDHRWKYSPEAWRPSPLPLRSLQISVGYLISNINRMSPPFCAQRKAMGDKPGVVLQGEPQYSSLTLQLPLLIVRGWPVPLM